MNSKYMNPYLAGFLLGLVLLATVFITGRGLGASGALKSVVTSTVWAVAPQHAAKDDFYSSSHPQGQNPLMEWLVFEALGVILGAFVSGVISDRLRFTLERPPGVKPWIRVVGAFAGGALFGLGSQLGRGCTSGAALSGMAVLSAGGFLTMLAIFGSAYAVAYFFRRLWI
jgi:uncharacterized membrane protein YedE/YeeE